ncbi:CPBP family intramembrane glutamic endopeptidase [Nocardioides sp. WG-D5]|uniref:CPBP family intramembrane glutamic endopeptidase n=1 Tax=Nocardioides luteus TaxID=1844 RepID=UPI0027D9F84D|nr:type II CAAX endopeptidase family protein [Nocardioides luteus]
MGSAVRRWVRRSLWDVVPRDHRQSDAALRRRQLVTAGFVLLGAVVLGVSLRIEPGSVWFYPATFALAGVWALGAFVSGPLHLGRIPAWRRHERKGEHRLVRPVLAPILIGLGLAGIFVIGGLVVREIDWLDRQVRSVLDFADQGSLPILVVVTAVNGVAEELFFRGALYAALPRHPVAWSSVAYVIATLATGNVMLTFAAILLGVVVGLERRASGGVLAPILTHCAWSLSMLLALPLLFG